MRITLLSVLFLVFSGVVMAGEVVTSPLTLSSTETMAPQTFSLSGVANIRIPQSVDTIGAAIDFILLGTGYRQAHDSVRSERDRLLMTKPLADSQRAFSQASLLNILESVSGIAFELVVDPVNYVVAFEVKREYR